MANVPLGTETIPIFFCVYIYYILLVNYDVLLHSVKEKMNSTEPLGTGIMLHLVEGLLTCS